MAYVTPIPVLFCRPPQVVISAGLSQAWRLLGGQLNYGVTGATSNPTIFAKAITDSDRYDGQLRELVAGGERDTRELFFSLALDDIRAAARLLSPAYEHSQGDDRFISFECTPDLADNTGATIDQATSLWQRLAQPNLMIKVPGTATGLPAIV